jgi:hypothetical protein
LHKSYPSLPKSNSSQLKNDPDLFKSETNQPKGYSSQLHARADNHSACASKLCPKADLPDDKLTVQARGAVA